MCIASVGRSHSLYWDLRGHHPEAGLGPEQGELAAEHPPGHGLPVPGPAEPPTPGLDSHGRRSGLPCLDRPEHGHEVPSVRQDIRTGALHEHAGGCKSWGEGILCSFLNYLRQITKKVTIFFLLYLSMLLGFFFVFILVVQGEDFTPVVKTFVRIGLVNYDYLNHTFNIDNVENNSGKLYDFFRIPT